MLIESVQFERMINYKRSNKYEEGIMINNDQLIIDVKGKPVDKIWNYSKIAILKVTFKLIGE